MLAQQPLHGEDAAATVPPRTGRPAHLRERPRAAVDALDDVAVADDPAVADNHGGEATLTTLVQSQACPESGPSCRAAAN
jgi:hypothetical protein